MQNSYQRQAASIVRSIIVAVATLATIGVGFAIYKLSETPEPVEEIARLEERVPQVPDPTPPMPEMATDDKGVAMGNGVVLGPGEGVTFRMYSTEGDRAVAVFKAQSWAPVEGTPNEFHVESPDVSVFTKSGHGINATAREGYLATRGKLGADADVRSGRLIGDVVIRIDRISREEREALPASLRSKIDPSQIITIKTDEIDFEYEYARVHIPGKMTLNSSDAVIETEDVEIRFNEQAGRVESCKVNGGGFLEFLKVYADVGLGVPGMNEGGDTRQSLTDWFGATVASALSAKGEMAAPAKVAEVERSDVPIFDSDEKDKAREDRPDKSTLYFARFEGMVRARQVSDGEFGSTLNADVLSILRDFTRKDRERMNTPSQPGTAPRGAVRPAGKEKQPTTERLILTWTERLNITAVADDMERLALPPGITATGSPVAIHSGGGSARCTSLTFLPDQAQVVLRSQPGQPASVALPDEGLITGKEIQFSESGDKFTITVAGPGGLRRGEGSGADDTGIRFANNLVVHGRVVRENLIDFRAGITRRTARVLESAVFDGRSTIHEGETSLTADQMEVDFATARTSDGIKQGYRRLSGKGNVIMVQGKDQLTSDQMTIELTTMDGKPAPTKAIATGNVQAHQGARQIRCAGQLIVDFDYVARALPEYNPIRDYQKAVEAGIDPSAIDWKARKALHESRSDRVLTVTRLRANEKVFVADSRQDLEVTGDSIDCYVTADQSISAARIEGRAEEPAALRLEQLNVVGNVIDLDALSENAAVDGEGMMTFLSQKDLDGQRVREPIPISITWGDSMLYSGEKNEAEFRGGVHASSRSSNTFDCDKLDVTFQEVKAKEEPAVQTRDWWVLNDVAGRLADGGGSSGGLYAIGGRSFDKEPAYMLATGNARAVMTEEEKSGRRKSRATIRGSRLSVDLRDEISRMLIEDKGTLLLEDFRPAETTGSAASSQESLFEIGQASGPSKTQITWQDQMWYDFGRKFAQFEGAVDLRYFSGRVLSEIFGGTDSATGPGRKTFLNCDTLTVAFASADEAGRNVPQSMRRRRQVGGMSAATIDSFQALRGVRLNDESDDMKMFIEAERISFERENSLLSAFGRPNANASFSRIQEGQLPQRVKALRFQYNTSSGDLKLTNPSYEGWN
ncbi:MAG: hypothetical protein ACYTHJ_11885 [Planctomycetota bacterium]